MIYPTLPSCGFVEYSVTAYQGIFIKETHPMFPLGALRDRVLPGPIRWHAEFDLLLEVCGKEYQKLLIE